MTAAEVAGVEPVSWALPRSAEEREAVKSAIGCCEDITYGWAADQGAAATLRGLLARVGGD